MAYHISILCLRPIVNGGWNCKYAVCCEAAAVCQYRIKLMMFRLHHYKTDWRKFQRFSISTKTPWYTQWISCYTFSPFSCIYFARRTHGRANVHFFHPQCVLFFYMHAIWDRRFIHRNKAFYSKRGLWNNRLPWIIQFVDREKRTNKQILLSWHCQVVVSIFALFLLLCFS